MGESKSAGSRAAVTTRGPGVFGTGTLLLVVHQQLLSGVDEARGPEGSQTASCLTSHIPGVPARAAMVDHLDRPSQMVHLAGVKDAAEHLLLRGLKQPIRACFK